MSETKQSISIWFFIGSLLAIYGVLITGSGLYELSNPGATHTVLAETHPAIWWGAFMLAIGLFYCIFFRPGRKV